MVLESDWLRQSWVCLTVTKQKHLINLFTLRMSSHMIRSRYIFDIGCFMSIEFSKVLQSNWVRTPLGTCKNSEKYNIHFQCSQLFTARQKNREKTGQAEDKDFTETPYTQVQKNIQVLIVAEEAVSIQTPTLLPPICFFWKNSF